MSKESTGFMSAKSWRHGASILALGFGLAMSGQAIGQAAPSAATPQESPAPDADQGGGPPPGERAGVAPAPPDPGDDDADRATADIIVTGTNISGVKPVGSDAITLTRETILTSGKTTAADVVNTLPQVRNLSANREGLTAGDAALGNQGASVNLRGLGDQATLILVDGRRVTASGASTVFTDTNKVPVAALERIEVINDGASAVYGSDAVAGVVNLVLRKDYNGVETSFRMSNNNGGAEVTPGLTLGKTWNAGSLGAGNIIVSYEYTDRQPYLRGKNKFLHEDLRAVGGPDLRLNGTAASAGVPGNIFVPTTGINNPTLPLAGTNVYYGLPASTTGVGITASQLSLNNPNLVDGSGFTDYIGSMKKHQVSAFFNQELGERVSVYLSGGYINRKTQNRYLRAFSGASPVQNVTVPQFLYNPVTNLPDPTRPNPAYINGIPGVAPGTAINVQYNLFDSIGYGVGDHPVENWNVTGGLKVRLPGSWKAEAYYTQGKDISCNFCATGTFINATALQYLINTGEVNPLSTATLSAAALAKFRGDNIQRGFNYFKDGVVKFDGPLFGLPGGQVRAAIGGEISRLEQSNLNGANRGINNAFTIDTDPSRSTGKRTVKSGFAEVYVPLVSEDLGVPLVKSLIVDGAVRYDDYSDVGSTTNPKVGVSWVATDFLSLRGSWGTSFRAPSLPDVNPFAGSGGVQTLFPVTGANPAIANDFCFGTSCFTTIAIIFGSNPDITPETATNWSVGADFTPIKHLKISGTYYNIKYSNRILGDVFGVIAAFQNPGYPGYNGLGSLIIPINNRNVTGPTTCSIDPLLQAYINRPILYGSGITAPCNVKVVLDGRNVNLAATKQDGLDATINYLVPIDDGAITFNASVNKILHNDQQANASAPFVSVLGRGTQPIEWAGRGSIGGVYRGFNAQLFMNYTGSYRNYAAVNPTTGAALDPQKVKAWTTFDLNVGYSTSLQNSALKGVRFSVNFQNVTDKDPPLVVTNSSAFNAFYSNPFGRTITAQVSASF